MRKCKRETWFMNGWESSEPQPTVENPTNSFLWELPYFQYAMQQGTLHIAMLALLEAREKTSFLSNHVGVLSMENFVTMLRRMFMHPGDLTKPLGLPHRMRLNTPMLCVFLWCKFSMTFADQMSLLWKLDTFNLHELIASHEAGPHRSLSMNIDSCGCKCPADASAGSETVFA